MIATDSLEARHARAFAAGLTQHSLTDILDAIAECRSAQAEALAARDVCIEALNADPGYQQWSGLPAYWMYLETDAAKAAHELLRTNTKDGCPGFPFGEIERWLSGSPRESYPIVAWRKSAKSWRRWAARVHKSLA